MIHDSYLQIYHRIQIMLASVQRISLQPEKGEKFDSRCLEFASRILTRLM